MIKRKTQLITSSFGHRTNPITGITHFHSGVDLRCVNFLSWRRQPAIFPERCVVTKIDNSEKWGGIVYYQSLNNPRYSFVSMHIDPKNICVKSAYEAGEVIGYGMVTEYMKQHKLGLHEHFVVKNGINLMNPIHYFDVIDAKYKYKRGVNE